MDSVSWSMQWKTFFSWLLLTVFKVISFMETHSTRFTGWWVKAGWGNSCHRKASQKRVYRCGTSWPSFWKKSWRFLRKPLLSWVLITPTTAVTTKTTTTLITVTITTNQEEELLLLVHLTSPQVRNPLIRVTFVELLITWLQVAQEARNLFSILRARNSQPWRIRNVSPPSVQRDFVFNAYSQVLVVTAVSTRRVDVKGISPVNMLITTGTLTRNMCWCATSTRRTTPTRKSWKTSRRDVSCDQSKLIPCQIIAKTSIFTTRQ